MELFKLIPATWKPGDTVTNYDSLIWTERYQTSGDFQLVMNDDISIVNTLPIGTLISHTDTTEIMIVENHEIDRNTDKKLVTTVSGRSFVTFLENRITSAATSPIESAGVQIKEIFHGKSYEAIQNLMKYAVEPTFTLVVDDAITNVHSRSEMTTAGDATTDQIIKRGEIYAAILDFLQLGNLGLKSVRPNGAQTTLDLVVYDGVDRHSSVIFYAQNEDLEDAKYLWSVGAYKNYANVAAKNFNHIYRQRDLGSDVTGLDRRRMYVEDSALDDTYVFGVSDAVVSTRAQAEMATVPRIQLLSATISMTATPKFKYNYNIGDFVTVFGEFAVADTMRVVEHILTKDDKGIQGYPSLSSA